MVLYCSGEIKITDLVEEVRFTLGVYLGLDESILRSVQEDCLRTADRWRNMLGTWMREQEATWSKVVQALVQIKMYHLAVRIASKYSKSHHT